VLYFSPAGGLAGDVFSRHVGGRSRRLPAGLELLGIAAAVLGLFVWTLDEGLNGENFVPLPLLLAGLALILAWLPGESRWFWRSWPLLALSLLLSLLFMLIGPDTLQTGLLMLLGAGAGLGAVWLLLTPAGLARLKGHALERHRQDTAHARRIVGVPWVQDGALPALTLGTLSLMASTPERLVGPFSSSFLATAVLLLGSVFLLVQARRQENQLRWWVGLAGFGLGALKLVFVDLEDLGGMARGAGTVLIGLLLLGIGQLAPRPEDSSPGELQPTEPQTEERQTTEPGSVG